MQGSAFGATSTAFQLWFICRCVQEMWRIGACEQVRLGPCGTPLCDQSASDTTCPLVADFLMLVMHEAEAIHVSPSGFWLWLVRDIAYCLKA